MRMLKILFLIFLSILCVLVYRLYTKSAFFTYHLEKKNVRIVRDVVYKEGSTNPKHTVDLYLPKDGHDFPMVYFVHGGNWNSGDKRYYQSITGVYGNIGVALAERGIGVAVASYRLFPEAGIKEQMADVTDGVAWIEAHAQEYGASDDIFLMGHSSGAHVVSMVAVYPELYAEHGVSEERIEGYILLSNVWDIQELSENSSDTYNAKVIVPLFGSTQKERANYSPQTYIDTIEKPIFMAVGELDYPYLKTQSEGMNARLAQRGRESSFMIIPGVTHSQLIIQFGNKGNALATSVADFIHEKILKTGLAHVSKEHL